SMKCGHAAPPVGRRSTIGPDQAKNQDQSQNQNQNRSKKGKPTEVCGPRVPPVGRPRGSEKLSERRFSSQYSPALVQAHSSMRICSAEGCCSLAISRSPSRLTHPGVSGPTGL